jgi:hypothetical protein
MFNPPSYIIITKYGMTAPLEKRAGPGAMYISCPHTTAPRADSHKITFEKNIVLSGDYRLVRFSFLFALVSTAPG